MSNERFTISAPTHDVFESYEKYQDEFESTIVPEPILLPDPRRIPRPILYPTIMGNWEKQLAIHWVPTEIDFSADVRHWKEMLTDDERHLLKHVLAFFASFDSIVNCNIHHNIMDVIQIKEAEFAYGKVVDMENIHTETYAITIESLVPNKEEQEIMFDSVNTMPTVRNKAEWCRKWIEGDKPLAHKIIAFAIVEGIFFSSAFAIIFWFKTRPGGVMPGLIVSNEFISRDEGLHVELASLIYALLHNRIKREVVVEIVTEAVTLETNFVNESLKNRMPGINADLMVQYVKYCADTLMVQLGYEKIYNCPIGLEYMNMIGLSHKSNFFEKRNSEYASAKIDNPRVLEDLEDF